MNKHFRIFILLFGFITVSSSLGFYAQTSYEQVYEIADQTVRDKMDENKMNGLPILSDILVTTETSFGGLSTNSDAERLMSILTQELDAKNITFSPDNSRVRYTYLVQKDLDHLKSILIAGGFEINNTYERVYSIDK